MSGTAAAPPVRWRSEAKEIGGFYTFLKSEVDKLKAAEGKMRTHAMKQCDVLLKEHVSFNPYIQRLYFEHQRKKTYGDSRYPQAYRYSVFRPRFPSVWDSSPAAVKRASCASRQSVCSYRSESSSEPTNAKIMMRTPKPERGRNKSPVTAEYRSDTRNPERGFSWRSPELIRYRSPDANPERAREGSPYRISEGSPYKYRKGNENGGDFLETTDKAPSSQRSFLDRSAYDRADRVAESSGRFVTGQQQEPQQSSYTARHQASIAPGQTASLVRTHPADARPDLRSSLELKTRSEDARIDFQSSSELRPSGGEDLQGKDSLRQGVTMPFSQETSGLAPTTYSENYSLQQQSASRLHHGAPGMLGGTTLDEDEAKQTPQVPCYSHRMVQSDPPPHRSDLIDTSSSSSQGTATAHERSSSRHASPTKLPIEGIYSYKVPAGGSYRMPDLSTKLPEARLAEGNVYIISDGNQYRTSGGRGPEHVPVGHLLYGNQERTPEPERSRTKTPESLFRQKRRKKFVPHRCDVKELIPEQRPMKRKYIQNKVPETRKYTFYKYYGFAGQGAKTSWAHNRPLGLSPPHAQRGAPQVELETLHC